MESYGANYTILRIKRKRNDEPLDALVIEGLRPKKSRGGVPDPFDAGVFQFAETVEVDVWSDELQANAMRDRLSNLARKIIPLKRKQTIINNEDVLSSPTHSLNPVVENPARRYTILTPATSPAKANHVQRADQLHSNSQEDLPHMSLRPPVVLSARELQEKKQRTLAEQFKMYDAVPTSQHISDPSNLPLEDDPEMASFIPMLKDYLRVNDIDVNDVTPISIPSATPEKSGAANIAGDDDYVWDVFIHRTMTLDEWNNVALLGSVTGLPPDDDYPSDESEVEDEADEDSNEENWYANDYPDEESDSSDGY